MNVLGIGIDIVETARIAALIERHGGRFLDRVFGKSESDFCLKMRVPACCFAARFAVKEAVAKALGTGIGAALGWLEIEVCRHAHGAPFVILTGAGAETARALGIAEVRISLSHSEHYAVATAIALGDTSA